MRAARSRELRRLRSILDYVPDSVSRSWEGRRYFDALARRLYREVAATPEPRAAEPAPTAPALAHEEWLAAERAREAASLHETELEALRRQLEESLQRLSTLAREKQEHAQRPETYLQLIGIRGRIHPEPPPPPVEEEPEVAPELRDEWEVVDAFEGDDEPLIAAPKVESRLVEAEMTMGQVRAAIDEIHEKLAQLAVEERTLVTSGVPELGGVHRVGDHALYARLTGPRNARRVDYVFSTEPVPEALPVPRPRGYRIKEDPETGVPSLVAPITGE